MRLTISDDDARRIYEALRWQHGEGCLGGCDEDEPRCDMARAFKIIAVIVEEADRIERALAATQTTLPMGGGR